MRALSNWTKFAGYPFGDRVTYDKYSNPEHDFPFESDFEASEQWHKDWTRLREGRSGYADPNHPFLHQGSAAINTYKMFLEVAHHALKPGGRMGFLVPSGIYSDMGAGALRQLFLNDSRWTNLYCFQNERFVFDSVHHSFKIAAIHVQKCGDGVPLMTRFRLGPGDSPEVNEIEEDMLQDAGYLSVTHEQIRRFSPSSNVIIETRTEREIEILEKLYGGHMLLGDKEESGWKIRFRQGEFNMTSDSRLFPTRQKWEEEGYWPDEYGNWLKGNWQPYFGPTSILKRSRGLVLSGSGTAAIQVDDIEDVALPLYQGGMINLFDFCAASYQRREGKLGGQWFPTTWKDKRVDPKYLMGRQDYAAAESVIWGWKLGYRGISATTNQRTFISSIVPNRPCGNSIFLMSSPEVRAWSLVAVTCSFAFDWIVRRRLGGSNLNFFMASELPVVQRHTLLAIEPFREVIASLQFPHPVFAQIWRDSNRSRPWKRQWAVTDLERLRLRVMSEAVVASLFGLGSTSFDTIVKECDYSRTQLESKPFTRTLDTKGFWRFEKGTDPELRIAILAQVAFRDLERVGLKEFLNMNDGDGWMLPETLRLADYGLGHDERAKEPQPVASRLGPRFYDWQLEQSVEESWEECERHAEILDRILRAGPVAAEPTSDDANCGPPTDLFGEPVSTDLFGTPLYTRARKR
jgi:hypothetical protein